MRLTYFAPKRIVTRVILASSALMLLVPPISATADRPAAEKIVIIVALSGVSNREKIHLQHLFGEGGMVNDGILYPNVKSLGFEFHMPILAGVLTGKVYDKYSVKAGLQGPTLFQLLRKKRDLPADKAWMIGAWHPGFAYYDKEGWERDTAPCQISPLITQLSPGIADCINSLWPYLDDSEYAFIAALPTVKRYYELYPHWDSYEDFQYRMLWKILKFIKPVLLCYVMSAPESAHYGTWSRYQASLRKSDEYIYNLWTYLKEDPYYRGRTYLLIYADHERNKYYMLHNSNLSDNPSVVWALVLKNFAEKGGVEDKPPLKHQDLFGMVSKWLDLP